jgi:uncharacterized protein
MQKLLVLLLAIVLLAVPVAAEGYHIIDDSGLLEDHDVQKLEEVYNQYIADLGFTPALVTTDSFGGLSAEEYAGQCYDLQDYPEDGILLLVSLEEGEWFILTNGECYRRISDADAAAIGEEIVPLIKDKSYYAAFLKFPQLAAEIFEANVPTEDPVVEAYVPKPVEPEKNYGKIILISMFAGLAIGGITVAIMAFQMKSVRQQGGAGDYIRPGSMHLTHSRDIFLYSHVSRTEKPKSNSSSGGGGGGGSRGGAGGRL